MSCNKKSKNQPVKFAYLCAWLVILAVVLSGLFYFIGMNTVKIKEGYEAVLIDKPLLFGQAGVRPETVKGGRVTVFWTTEIVEVSVQPTNMNFDVWGVRLADRKRESRFEDASFTANLSLRYRITDPIAYVSMGIGNWFSSHMLPMFTSRLKTEYAAIKWAEMDNFPAYSIKINAALLAGFNAELKKAGIPVEVVDVVVR